MRKILSRSEAQKFLDQNWKLETLFFKWTTSKGVNTFGYHICTLKDKRGNKINSNCGGGYDMKGTALGDFINEYFYDQIRKLDASKFYGLTHYGKNYKRLKHASKLGKSYVDGGCGFSSMSRILEKIGFSLEFIKETHNEIIYNLRVK